MEDSQWNGTVEKPQDMEPSVNHDKKPSVEEFNSVVDGGISDAQQEKISEEDEESDEKSPQAEYSVGLEVEKDGLKSVVEPFMSLPEVEELSLNGEQAVAKSVEPNAVIEVANKGLKEKTSQSPEGKVGNSSTTNPNVGINGLDGITQPTSYQKATIASIMTDMAPKGIDEYKNTLSVSDIADETPKRIEKKENGDRPPKGDREAERPAVVESTRESSTIFDEEAVNNVDALLNQSVDIPGVGSSDGGEEDNKAKITERSEKFSRYISLTQRTLAPTSWRSCCGLLEVLRQSNR